MAGYPHGGGGGEGTGAENGERWAERVRKDAMNRGGVPQGTARRTWVCTAGRWRFGARLACGVVVSHESAQLFQPWDVPTAQPVSERGLAPRRSQGLLRRWVHTPLEAMAGQHQEQGSPDNPHPGLRRT